MHGEYIGHRLGLPHSTLSLFFTIYCKETQEHRVSEQSYCNVLVVIFGIYFNPLGP